MRKLLFVSGLALCLGCGGSPDPGPEASETKTGCAVERGSPLPAELMGEFQLVQITTEEEGIETKVEAVAPEKSILLTLSEGDSATEVSVENRLTTDAVTHARGRVTLEGASQLAVAVDESEIPLVFAGATYCLGLKPEADSFTVILEVTASQCLHYRFTGGREDN